MRDPHPPGGLDHADHRLPPEPHCLVADVDMDYWQGRCPLTGITDPALLRASHIIPWKDCNDDAERLNVHNGLLLSALWDAAFDRGLLTFNDDGCPEFSPAISEAARAKLRWSDPIPVTDKHKERLVWHRVHHFLNEAS